LKISPRGIALPTSMFIVMLLFALITVTVTVVNQNIQFTKYSHLKTRAYFLAKAAVNLAMKNMTSDSTWESSHTGEAQAYREIVGDRECILAWTEAHPSKADFIYVCGKGILDPGSPHPLVQRFEMVVRKKPRISGFVYMRRNLAGPDVLYTLNADGTWAQLPPAPRKYYNNDFTFVEVTPSGTSDYAGTLKYLVGDRAGNCYALWPRDGPDTIYKYSKADGEWKAMKPPRKQYYNGSGTLIEDTEPVPNISDLATDGKSTLFARYSRDGIDTLYRCNLDTEGWDVLPPAPRRYYTSSGTLEAPGGYAGNLVDLASDSKGNLYSRYSRDGIDTIYRYDNSAGAWQWLPAVPRKYYRYVSGQVELFEPPGQLAGAVQCLSASYDGTLYGRYARDGIDTIYRFSPNGSAGGGVLDGRWTTVPPPAKVFYDNLGNLHGTLDDGADNDPVPDANFDRSAMDGSDKLYLRYPKFGYPDTIITLVDGSTPGYDCLPPVPAYRYSWNTAVSPGRLELVPKLSGGNPVYEAAADELGGGGIPDPVGGFTYVVTSNF
jgi:hypothetical protein